MKKTLALFLAVLMLFALCACGGSDTAPKDAEDSAAVVAPDEILEADAAGTETADGKKILRVGCMEAGGGYCPWGDDQSSIGNNLVYEHIAQRMPDGHLEPWCCESFEWTDETTLVFHMRDDVYFADGDKMTGEDLLYSFYMTAQGVMASDFAPLNFDKSYVSDDGMTVTFIFDVPYGPIESSLDVPLMCNKSAAENLASDEPGWWTEPQGSGPYTVKENVAGSHATYVLQDNYWNLDFEPQWDEIIVNYYQEPTAMFIAFENGELDLVCSVAANDAARLQNGNTALGDKAAYEFITDNSVYCLNLNNNRPELQDPKVREAIAHAIDTDGLGQVAFGILYKTADSQLSENTKFYRSMEPYTYDVEYAKKCMAESNYPEGFSLDVVAMTGAETTAMWEVIQGCLEQIGIKVNFQSYDMGTCLNLWMQPSGNDLFFVSVYGGNAMLEPVKSIGQTKSTTPFPAAVIPDEEYQQHLYNGTYTSRDAEREEDFVWLQNWLHDNFQCIPLVENLQCYAYNVDTVDHCEFYSGSIPNLLWCFSK